MKNSTALIWFRDDLRVHDHEALTRASTRHSRVVGIFCFNPTHFELDEYGFPRVGRHRLRFLQESVDNLRANLSSSGIPLLVYKENPAVIIPEVVRSNSVDEVFAQKALTPAEVQEEIAVTKALPKNVKLQYYSGQFLIHPDDIPFDLNSFPPDFSTFRKEVEKKCEPRELFDVPLLADEQKDEFLDISLGIENIYTDSYVRDKRTSFPYRGGEMNALYRVNEYLWDTKYVTRYKETRNDMVGTNSSTKFSPWLANGSLSPRYVLGEINRFEKKVVQNGSTYWVFYELLWRDFYKYIALIHGRSIFNIDGIGGETYSYEHDQELVDKWISASTGEGIVDAVMTELNSTGWVSSRGRQIASSYFCHDLRQDWRIGASWFASQLVDLDIASNWGNWMFMAGVGSDQERNHRLNPKSQAERYDQDGRYRDLWLRGSDEPVSDKPRPGNVFNV